MKHNIERKNANDKETLSDQEIWRAIRYLDPDGSGKASDREFLISLLAVFYVICVVVVLFYSCGF
jgi:hypothetical protein